MNSNNTFSLLGSSLLLLVPVRNEAFHQLRSSTLDFFFREVEQFWHFVSIRQLRVLISELIEHRMHQGLQRRETSQRVVDQQFGY